MDEYLDFDVEVAARASGDYDVSVRSPAGEATGTMHFPFDVLALQTRLQALQIALLRAGRSARRVDSPEERTVRQFGQELFEALFSEEVRYLFEVSRGEARQRSTGMRVKLTFGSPELATLPWEYLYDPRRGDYLALSTATPLVRYIRVPQPIKPLTVRPPLRILAMVANPSDVPELDTERERQRLDLAVADLRSRGLVELEWVRGQTWRELQQALLRGPWHIFHFVGHGGFDEVRGEGVVLLADDRGRSYRLSATDLGRLVGDLDPTRLVVLNACEGARADEVDVFSSTAAVLVRRGIPAVVAMQYEITDTAAIEFSRSLYETIAGGWPIDAAVAVARKGIALANPGTLEWGTPVLFMRASNGVLFDLTSVGGSARPVPPVETLAPLPSAAILPEAPMPPPPAVTLAKAPTEAPPEPAEAVEAVAEPPAASAAILPEAPTPPAPEAVEPSGPVEAQAEAEAEVESVAATEEPAAAEPPAPSAAILPEAPPPPAAEAVEVAAAAAEPTVAAEPDHAVEQDRAPLSGRRSKPASEPVPPEPTPAIAAVAAAVTAPAPEAAAPAGSTAFEAGPAPVERAEVAHDADDILASGGAGYLETLLGAELVGVGAILAGTAVAAFAIVAIGQLDTAYLREPLQTIQNDKLSSENQWLLTTPITLGLIGLWAGASLGASWALRSAGIAGAGRTAVALAISLPLVWWLATVVVGIAVYDLTLTSLCLVAALFVGLAGVVARAAERWESRARVFAPSPLGPPATPDQAPSGQAGGPPPPAAVPVGGPARGAGLTWTPPPDGQRILVRAATRGFLGGLLTILFEIPSMLVALAPAESQLIDASGAALDASWKVGLVIAVALCAAEYLIPALRAPSRRAYRVAGSAVQGAVIAGFVVPPLIGALDLEWWIDVAGKGLELPVAAGAVAFVLADAIAGRLSRPEPAPGANPP